MSKLADAIRGAFPDLDVRDRDPYTLLIGKRMTAEISQGKGGYALKIVSFEGDTALDCETKLIAEHECLDEASVIESLRPYFGLG